jgi:transcriptional regulator with XRE-family HTH domain
MTGIMVHYAQIGGVMGYYDSTIERAESLKQFSAEAHSVDLKVDAEFQRILREAQALLETSDQEIADALSVSRPTVNRWMNGKNLPYNAMRKPILTWIGEQLSVKIKRLEGSARQFAASAGGASPRQVASSSGYGSRSAVLVAKGR